MGKTANGRALVIGGSMSGLLAGLLLRRHGWDVEIFERVESELAGRGAGIVAQPELIETLRGLGIDPTDLGVQITTRKILDASGRLAGEYPCPQVLTAWERVYRVLRDAFPPERYHRGRGVKSFEQSEGAVVAHFSDGSTAEGDLLVGADGLRSTIRQQCLPELAPLYAGYVAWRALIAEQAFPPAIHRELFEYMTFCLPPGEQCLGYPVAGPDNDLRPSHRRYNVVWYRPADETTELQRLLTDAHGTTHTISIPPPLIRHEAIAAMRAAAERLLPPQFREIVRLIDEPILQPIYDLETPRMAFGRVAIIGDAAFVARPHVAAGVAKAADDAAALAAALASEASGQRGDSIVRAHSASEDARERADDTRPEAGSSARAALAGSEVEPALVRFEAARLPVGQRIIERARHLGAYLQATQTAEERARSQRHGIPEAVLAETAVLDFLRT